MSKLIMFSLIIMTVAIPIRLSNAPAPKKALERAVRIFVIFNFVYVLLLCFVVPRLL